MLSGDEVPKAGRPWPRRPTVLLLGEEMAMFSLRRTGAALSRVACCSTALGHLNQCSRCSMLDAFAPVQEQPQAVSFPLQSLVLDMTMS